MKIYSAILLLLFLMLTGCWITKDYGLGECREYKPWCWSGDEVCERDIRGCEVCTCVERGGTYPDKR